MTFTVDRNKNDPTRRYRLSISDNDDGARDRPTSHPRRGLLRVSGKPHCAQMQLILWLTPRLQRRKHRHLHLRLAARQVNQLALVMSSTRCIRPVMDPHYHYDQEGPFGPTYHVDPYAYPGQGQPMHAMNQMNPNFEPPMSRRYSRRYSSPQMGYYDLITGEYRYRSSADHHNQSPLLSNYQGETEPPMCENTCACCSVQIPFNWLTICLITSLMLLLMFSLFKLLLGSKDPSKSPSSKSQSAAAVNMNLFQDMIWLMTGLTLLFILLIVLRYTCFSRASLDCDRCRLVQAMRESSGNGAADRSKRPMYSRSDQVNQFAVETGEDFV